MGRTQTTQLEAWEDLQPNIGKAQKTIYSVIAGSVCGLALFEICRITGWPVNRISGRVRELNDKLLSLSINRYPMKFYTGLFNGLILSALLWVLFGMWLNGVMG